VFSGKPLAAIFGIISEQKRSRKGFKRTMKLLVIDDDLPILEMLEMSLNCEGYEVLTAESGEEGLRIFQEQAPRLVLTDIKMPGMDGIEVLKRIKAMDSKAQVIVVTGHGDPDTAEVAFQHGASDFICKPIRDDVLIMGLERAKKTFSC
jgi:DNA-binding NtrC family response regulator